MPIDACTAAAIAPSTKGPTLSRTCGAAFRFKQVERHPPADHGAAQIHQHQHPVVVVHLANGLGNGNRVGAKRLKRVVAAAHRHNRRPPLDLLIRQGFDGF